MDHFLHTIIDITVVDKREAGGASTTMEKMALKRLLERMMVKLHLSELTTDASATIMKLVRDLKALHPNELMHLVQSLDIWHKSCKLTAKLTAASKVKGCENVSHWIEPIRNHFWHCAEMSKGSPELLKDVWIGVIHHVCGEHEWEDGQCTHGPLTHTEESKPVLEKTSKSAKAIREIVFDRDWLRSLHYYVNFRHTSHLESFNAMVLKYAPKRIAFVYEVFIARVQLAALDHNFHLFRKILEGRMKKIYSKRSKNWKLVPLKETKTFGYWGILVGEMLKRRAEDRELITRHIWISPTNPQNLAPTIAMRAPPETSELVSARLSRFQKKK
ncbi:hypothetical protein QZH41_010466 [Actinostola sp. cb2023]|nr:hypothetical protein QZH41_010466 [Actinostola sp. cb2023]